MLGGARLDWMLVGSAATALHGVPVEPGDLDVLMPTPEAVRAAAGVLPARAERCDEQDPAGWFSSRPQPVLTFGDADQWTFGRWLLAGTTVEVAHIADRSAGDLVVETMGPAVWKVRTVVDLDGVRVPIVPLEVQLATMVTRGQLERLRTALTALGPGALELDRLRGALADRAVHDGPVRLPDELRAVLADGQR